ncbi:ATP-grasp fold amidoligase family protein [Rhizobium sp. TRM95796]|uniref:ATP-grasp fold amidoligase family protein n=1 Tax=Rhizobium sp. TRM95796 TaxID=2979862 RepID=UPI0021E965BE|nr:ATP-grasp fold amidoligase family protein [Rhizobium sp. TRM95796]MCV3768810.1 polysaccharide biosynthesis protein [Rhizobium sp. TRM95796]
MSEADRKETFLIPGYQHRTLKELAHHAIWRLIAPLPDRPYIAVKYRVIKGAWPDLKQPKTFTEKVQARKLHDRNPLFPVVVDKAAMKDYVARRVGGDYVIPSYWVGTDLMDVDWKAVELPAVVKPTHASAQGRFLYNARDIDNLLTDNPAPRWLTLDHAAYNREWAYAEVSPRIVIEQMLRTQGGIPWDYRVFTFNGVVSHIEVNMRVEGKGYACHYSPAWEKLPFHDPDYLPLYSGEVKRPARLEEMLRVAETLGSDFDFVRVDLYADDQWIKVGELTLYPGGGFERFDPPDYDRWLGDKWTLAFEIP